MRAFNRSLAAMAVSGLALSACSGGGSSPAAPIHTIATTAPSGSSGTGTSSALSPATFAYDASFVKKAQLLSNAKFGNFGIDVVLKMRDARGIQTFAQQVSDPKSGSYRQFLTPAQIADRFGASAADQKAAIAYFHTFGIWASGWQQRMMIHVAGTQAQLESAFHTKFGNYRSPAGELFIAPEIAPSVAANVPIVGSVNIVHRTKRFATQFITSKGSGVGYSPQQIASAFDYNGAYAAGYTGSGVTIGIIGTGPIVTSTKTMIGDADAYREYYKVAGSGTVTLVPTTGSDPVVNGASGFTTPLPVTVSGCTSTDNPNSFDLPYSESPTATCNPEDGEAQLDTEQAATLARDSSVEFYLAYNPNDGCVDSSNNPIQGSPCPAGAGIPLQGLAEADEELQTIIDHNTADVVSGSFDGPEPSQVGDMSPPAEFTSDASGLDPTEYAMMVAEGMAVFISSGDVGANACQQEYSSVAQADSLCVEYPASDPSVSGVGGVTTPLTAAGLIAGPITAWGVSTSGGFDSASGGGVSAYFPLPSYQTGAAGILGTNRNVPDLALEGDPSTGVSALEYADPSFGGPELFDVGGTSVAAPEAAAMWALVVQACKQTPACSGKGSGAHPYRLGNPDPMLYTIYKSAATYGTTFLPVTYGNNADVAYCSNPSNVGATPCPVPAPTGTPSIPPLDPGYNANPNGGYNQLTGLGVPFGRSLIRAVVGV